MLLCSAEFYGILHHSAARQVRVSRLGMIGMPSFCDTFCLLLPQAQRQSRQYCSKMAIPNDGAFEFSSLILSDAVATNLQLDVSK